MTVRIERVAPDDAERRILAEPSPVTPLRLRLLAAMRERAARHPSAARLHVEHALDAGPPPWWFVMEPARKSALPLALAAEDEDTVFVSLHTLAFPDPPGDPLGEFMECFGDDPLGTALDILDAAIGGRLAVRRWLYGERPTGLKYDILTESDGRLRTRYRSRDFPFFAPFARRTIVRFEPY